MFKRISSRKKKIILIAWGGIGDAVVCTPTIRQLKIVNPDSKIILYYVTAAQRAVFLNNPYIDSLRYFGFPALLIYPRFLYAQIFNRSLVKATHLWFQHVQLWPNVFAMNAKEVAADMFGLKLTNTNADIFLTEKEERNAKSKLQSFKNSVILHVGSISSENNSWQQDKWDQLVERTPSCTFIQVGLTKEPPVKGAVDWRGKLSIREIFGLIKFANAYVGILSGFAHVTNAFGTRGVILFGPSSPRTWGHDNNINIYKNIACSPCYYHIGPDTCPFGHECMTSIDVTSVRSSLLSQLA